ncbi:MAG: oxidoreductase [Sphingobium sp.]|nr:MAG: oxidoreductase [Sphingobium sp.]
MMLKVGIVSANWGVVAHLPAWRSIHGVEVVAICTSRRETAEAAAERHGIARAYWNVGDMIAEPDIDIIDCGARPSIRQTMVVDALHAGKHVYNGIPFAADIGHARAIHAAWCASGRIGVTDAFSQWVPALTEAKAMIEQGYLGAPLGGHALFNLSLFNRPHPNFPYNWFADGSAGVSAMRNLGSHMLNVLVNFFGDAVEVVADDRQLLAEWRYPDGSVTRPETNDYANLILRFANGMTLPVQLSWSASVGLGFTLDMFGTDGRILVTDPSFPTTLNARIEAGKVGGRTLEPVEIHADRLRPHGINVDLAVQPQAVHGMAIGMQRMVRAIRGDGQAAPDFAQAWHVEQILEAARRSSLERRPVAIAEIA